MRNAIGLSPAGIGAPNGKAEQVRRSALATYLSQLPSLGLSETGRRSVAARFGLSDTELSAALATAQRHKGGQP